MQQIRPFPLINPHRKFILFTNAKCGGTLLKSWFLKTMDIEENFSGFFRAASHYNFAFVLRWFLHYKTFISGAQIVNSDRYLRKFIKDYRKATQELLPQVIDKKSWFRFAIVRNPYDRLVSAYVDKFCGRDLQTRWVQKIVQAVNARDKEDQPAISFSQFVDYLSQTDNDRVNVHWRRQSRSLEGVKLDAIIALRDLSHQLPKLEKKLGLNTGINLSQHRQANNYQNQNQDTPFSGGTPNTELIKLFRETGRFPSKDSFYNTGLRRQVKKIYAQDFKLYPFQDPG